MPKTLEGYGAVFYKPGDEGSEYHLATDVVERVMPGAFAKSLASSADISALWNHNPDFLLGKRSAGTLRLSVDARGLKYSIDYDQEDPQHQTVYRKLFRGDVKGSSFSFTVRKENVRREGGGFIRELLDVNLIEVSPVWRPAYDSTTATARGLSVREEHDRLQNNPVERRYRQIESDMVEERFKEIERQQVKDRLWQLTR
jgi:hypothetical protein